LPECILLDYLFRWSFHKELAIQAGLRAWPPVWPCLPVAASPRC
jgi:hypothetical protein